MASEPFFKTEPETSYTRALIPPWAFAQIKRIISKKSLVS
jgi:hypothetical protein